MKEVNDLILEIENLLKTKLKKKEVNIYFRDEMGVEYPLIDRGILTQCKCSPRGVFNIEADGEIIHTFCLDCLPHSLDHMISHSVRTSYKYVKKGIGTLALKLRIAICKEIESISLSCVVSCWNEHQVRMIEREGFKLDENVFAEYRTKKFSSAVFTKRITL